VREDEVEEIARRKTIYTWGFRNSPCVPTPDAPDSLTDVDKPASEPATGGDRPPDPMD
jgi:hypothetical protein